MKKKLLTALLLIGLVGCGTKDKPKEDEPQDEPQTEQSEKKEDKDDEKDNKEGAELTEEKKQELMIAELGAESKEYPGYTNEQVLDAKAYITLTPGAADPSNDDGGHQLTRYFLSIKAGQRINGASDAIPGWEQDIQTVRFEENAQITGFYHNYDGTITYFPMYTGERWHHDASGPEERDELGHEIMTTTEVVELTEPSFEAVQNILETSTWREGVPVE